MELLIPYRTKIRRTKLPKTWLGAENFVHRKPPRTIFGGQNCRNFELVPKILSAEKCRPRKILSAEFLSDKVSLLKNGESNSIKSTLDTVSQGCKGFRVKGSVYWVHDVEPKTEYKQTGNIYRFTQLQCLCYVPENELPLTGRSPRKARSRTENKRKCPILSPLHVNLLCALYDDICR